MLAGPKLGLKLAKKAWRHPKIGGNIKRAMQFLRHPKIGGNIKESMQQQAALQLATNTNQMLMNQMGINQLDTGAIQTDPASMAQMGANPTGLSGKLMRFNQATGVLSPGTVSYTHLTLPTILLV